MSADERFTGPAPDPFRYRVENPEQGSSGGQGIVYRAWTNGPDDQPECVALKLLSAPNLDVPRILAMAEHLRSIDNPHLARQRDVFCGTGLCARNALRGDDGVPFDVWYTASDWIDGCDLDEAIADADIPTALNWVAEVAEALAYLHGLGDGVIHRDVKPSNVRITPELKAVVIDYGSARTLMGATMTQGVGTPGWQAPEVLFEPSQVGLAADAWGAAALAHWVVTGVPPTIATREAHLERLRSGAARSGIKHPTEFARLVAPLLSTEPDARGAQSAAALNKWATKLRALARGAGRSHRKALAVLAAATVCGVLGAGTALALRLPSNDQATHSSLSASQTRTKTPNKTTTTQARSSTPGKLTTASTTTTIAATTKGGSVNSPTDAGNAAAQTTPHDSANPFRVETVTTVPGHSTGNLANKQSTSPHPTSPAATNPPQTSPPATAALPTTRFETTGGTANTWTNYTNAGGTHGPTIPANASVQISCRITGFRVADGNTWWYRIGSSPWNNLYYVSADAFYNNGQTSGSLHGTPFVDAAVPTC